MNEREAQAEHDRAEIKVKLIENGILVKAGPGGWFTFADWPLASQHIENRIKSLKEKRSNGTHN